MGLAIGATPGVPLLTTRTIVRPPAATAVIFTGGLAWACWWCAGYDTRTDRA